MHCIARQELLATENSGDTWARLSSLERGKKSVTAPTELAIFAQDAKASVDVASDVNRLDKEVERQL